MESFSVLITGASTGFGYGLALALRERGHRAVASMRDVKGRNAGSADELRAAGAEVVELDVTDDASVTSAVEQAGTVDVLVNNAGFGIMGPVEATTVDDLREQFETNVFGLHRVVRAVLPQMRGRGSGLIVSLSSGAGRFAMPGQSPYNASKWALEALAESMRYELAPLGVDSVVVEPGPYKTNFVASMRPPSDAGVNAAYAHIAEHARYRGERMKAADPAEVVDAIVDVIETPRGKRPTRVVVHPYFGEELERLNEAQSEMTHRVLDLYGPGRLKDSGV